MNIHKLLGSVILILFASNAISANDCDYNLVSGAQRYAWETMGLDYTSKTLDSPEDVVEVTAHSLKKGRIKFCLKQTRDVWWWKGLKVCDRAGRLVTFQEIQDDFRSSCSAEMPMSKFPGAQGPGPILVMLMKAKTLGVHTPVHYISFSGKNLTGQTVTFTWSKDR